MEILQQQIDYKALAIDFCNAVLSSDYDFMCQNKASFTLVNIHKYSITDKQDYDIITTFVTKVGF